MTLYIDQFVLINLLLNYIILHITKSIIKSQKSSLRLFSSAVFGAVFSVLFFLPQLYFLNSNIFKIFISAVMVIIAYGAGSIKRFLKNFAVFFLVSFLIGGCGFALFESGLYETAYVLILSTGLSYIILSTTVSVFEKYFKIDRLTHTLTIKLFENEITTECFYDTGNNLKDPITNLPVIIVSYEILKEILPEKLASELINQQDIFKIYSTNNTDLKLKLIPFKTISDNGFIIGFVPKMILIDGIEKKAIIGVSPKAFAVDKKHKAIANPQIN